jgi:hypothetical protein
LPYPERILFTEASVNDLSLLKENGNDRYNRTFFGDKIYGDSVFWQGMKAGNKLEMLTPVKVSGGKGNRKSRRIKLLQIYFQLLFLPFENRSNRCSVG